MTDKTPLSTDVIPSMGVISTEVQVSIVDMLKDLNMAGPVVVMGWARDGTDKPLIFAKGTKQQLLRLNEYARRNFMS